MEQINWPAFIGGVVFGFVATTWYLIRRKKRKIVPDFFKTGKQDVGDNYPPGFDETLLD